MSSHKEIMQKSIYFYAKFIRPQQKRIKVTERKLLAASFGLNMELCLSPTPFIYLFLIYFISLQ